MIDSHIFIYDSIKNKSMKESQVLTSVKVNEVIWDEFRISCVKYKFSFQKLSDRAMHLYVTDPEFRKQIHNHTNIDIKQEEK